MPSNDDLKKKFIATYDAMKAIDKKAGKDECGKKVYIIDQLNAEFSWDDIAKEILHGNSKIVYGVLGALYRAHRIR